MIIIIILLRVILNIDNLRMIIIIILLRINCNKNSENDSHYQKSCEESTM